MKRYWILAGVLSWSLLWAGTCAFAQGSGNDKTWTCLNLLDTQTKQSLAARERFLADLYPLPEAYVNGAAAIRKAFVERWLEELLSGDSEKRTAAAAYLGLAKVKEAAEPVTTLLAGGAVTGRPLWICTRTLGLTGSRESIPLLVDLLESTQKDAQFYARIGLAEIAGVDFGNDTEKWAAWRMADAVRQLRRLIDENYSYYLLCGVDWDAMFTQYGLRMERARTPQEFAEQAAHLLSRTKDRHISVRVGEEVFLGLRKSIFRNYNRRTLKAVLPSLQEHNARVSSASIDSDIGYIQINSWDGDSPETLDAAFAALKEYATRPRLIVDVRANGGGSEGLAQRFAGCFVESPAVYGRYSSRTISAPSGWTRESVRTLRPNPDQPTYKGQVALLIGQGCQSACESFILMMQQTPNCVLIGHKSYGSSGNPREYDLGNGVTVRLPSSKMMKADGSLVEQEGIEPDVFVRTNETDLRTRDRTLEAAIRYLRRP